MTNKANQVVEYVITRSSIDKKLYNVLGLNSMTEIIEVVDSDIDFDSAVLLCEDKNSIFQSANAETYELEPEYA